MQTTDPNFAARLAAYEENRKRGVVFAADGTVGGHVAAPPRPVWRGRFLQQTARLILLAAFLKVGVFHAGAMAGYNARATIVMQNSSFVDKALALVFYPDPLSFKVSQYLRIGQQYLAIELRKIL